MFVGALAGKMSLLVCQLIPRAPQSAPQRCFLCLEVSHARRPWRMVELAGVQLRNVVGVRHLRNMASLRPTWE